MAHFLAQYTRIASGANVCDNIVDLMIEEGRSAPAARQMGRISRQMIETALEGSACGPYLSTRSAAEIRPAAYRQSTGQPLSAEAHSLYDQINHAMATTITSGDLAVQLFPILDAADALTATGESDMISSAASVAQSSREFWEVQLVPSNYSASIVDGTNQYRSCFAQYSDAATAVLQCMGLSEPRVVVPTSLQGGDFASSPFRLVQSQACWDQNMNGGEIVHQDFVGAFAGAVVGFWTSGPAGAAAGAALGGSASSAAEVAWQVGKTAYCNYKTGGWDRPRPEPI